MHASKLFTIGFTKKSAEAFFTRLFDAGVKRVIDVRLNNVSQLAGFAKRDGLAYFLKSICQCGYRHEPRLAPPRRSWTDIRRRKYRGRTMKSGFWTCLSEEMLDRSFRLRNLKTPA